MYIDDNNDKNDHNAVLNKYIDASIVPTGQATPIACLLTLLFLYQKLNDNFLAKWQACFYPIFLLLAYQFVKYFARIIKSETSEEEVTEVRFKLRIKNFEQIVLISNFFALIHTSLLIMTVYYICEFLDKKEDAYLFYTLYMVASYCLSQVIYTNLRKSSLFSFKREGHSSFEENGASNNTIAFISSLTAPALTYMSNMLIVCNSGACTQIYASTITSLLGAFGVTLSDFSEYLFPITVVLLCLSLFSLYIKNKRLTHPPLLLGTFATGLIIISHIFDESLGLLSYPGNILMIAAAIWNARINKFSGLPRFSK